MSIKRYKTQTMHWRRKLMLSRRLRKIIYIVTVSVTISLGIYNQFGENVSNNSRAHSNLMSMSNQVLSPRPIKLTKENTRDAQINRKLKRLTSEERVSNVRYITLAPLKKTHSIVFSSKNLKLESYELKRARESYRPKHAVRSQFQYTQMSRGDKEGHFYQHLNNKVRSRSGEYALVKSVGKSTAFVKGSIRFYTKPEWFSVEDIDSMVILSDKEITRINNAELHSDGIGWKILMFSKDDIQHGQFKRRPTGNLKQSDLLFYRGLTSRLLSVHEVLAFHLDRVLGFGRALPTVAKHIKGTSASTLNVPENSLHSILGIDRVDIQSVDGLIKRDVLACKSVQRVDLDATTNCGDIDGLEWGKLALFDFLLQIHYRLNKHCCGFQPDSNDRCLITIETSRQCSNTSSLDIGIVHKARNNHQLIFLKNDMNMRSLGNSIDFDILRGIRKFPVRAVDIIRKGKLKLMLLQSLFIDKAYWDGVGGRPGIDKILNVIVERARLFLEYYDTHINPSYRLGN